MVKVETIMKNIKEHSVGTELFKRMIERDGKFVIHRGSKEPDTLFIGEAGGKEEDKQGKPFVGRSGELLTQWIYNHPEEIGEYAIINSVPIMPENIITGGIRKPTNEEIKHFRKLFLDLIEALNPRQIILLGRSAEYGYYGDNNLLQNGEWHDKVGLIYHPSYYLRNGRNGLDDFEKLLRKRK